MQTIRKEQCNEEMVGTQEAVLWAAPGEKVLFETYDCWGNGYREDLPKQKNPATGPPPPAPGTCGSERDCERSPGYRMTGEKPCGGEGSTPGDQHSLSGGVVTQCNPSTGTGSDKAFRPRIAHP